MPADSINNNNNNGDAVVSFTPRRSMDVLLKFPKGEYRAGTPSSETSENDGKRLPAFEVERRRGPRHWGKNMRRFLRPLWCCGVRREKGMERLPEALPLAPSSDSGPASSTSSRPASSPSVEREASGRRRHRRGESHSSLPHHRSVSSSSSSSSSRRGRFEPTSRRTVSTRTLMTGRTMTTPSLAMTTMTMASKTTMTTSTAWSVSSHVSVSNETPKTPTRKLLGMCADALCLPCRRSRRRLCRSQSLDSLESIDDDEEVLLHHHHHHRLNRRLRRYAKFTSRDEAVLSLESSILFRSAVCLTSTSMLNEVRQ